MMSKDEAVVDVTPPCVAMMIRRFLAPLLWIGAAGALTGTARQPGVGQSRGAHEPGVSAVTGVNVIPMSRDTVLRNMTVVIRDGRIALVGPAATTRVPEGARRIDGTGRFLIPGLADMHTHLHSDDPAIPDSIAPAELGVMVANGVTAIRLMIGTPHHLTLRNDVTAGKMLGPQLWVASPQVTGRVDANSYLTRTPEEGRDAVRRAAEGGFDFVKLTLELPRAVYDAIVEEARRRNIGVVGHVDVQVGVARALETGQQLEHLDAYLEAALADSAPMRLALTQGLVFQPANWASMDHIDDRKVDRIAGVTARAGAWIVPTLFVFNTAFAVGEPDSLIRSRPDWGLMPPAMRAGYLRAKERYWAPETAQQRTPPRRARYVATRNRLVRAIHDSGGRILAGSDSPEWFHEYGFALHRELQAFVAAGLTPYAALATATRNAAEYLGQSRQWGTIEAGKRADLVLLSANPLISIRNTERIEWVAVGGRWMSRAQLDGLIDAAAARLQALP
jgi:imidazolonepropionase-like amidohydrolase